MRKLYSSTPLKLIFLFSFCLFQQTAQANSFFAKPVLTGVPDNITVECDAIPDLPTVTATDDCDGEITISLTQNIITINNGCDDSYNLRRTWTASNDCGKQTVKSQTIRVRDKTVPVLTGVPTENITVECNVIPAPPTVTAADNCAADVEVTLTEEIIPLTDNCTNNYNIKRVWSATDNCGNTVTESQTVRVRDKTDPVLIGLPEENITVECDAIPDPPNVTATDNCDGEVTISLTENIIEINNACANGYNIKRVWTATDVCGNTISESQTVRVRDRTDPILGDLPENGQVDGNNIPTPASVTVTDNCDTDVEITLTEDKIILDENCPDSYNLKRKWTATDNCGNTATHTQTLRVRDTENPILSAIPATITTECDAIPDPDGVTATDNFDEAVEISVTEVRTDGDCPNYYTLTRTWVATDNCGNTDEAIQVITVEDNTKPTLSAAPDDVTVDCNNIPVAASLTASDNCDEDVEITVSDVRTDGACADNYILTRTWRATDNCGNEATVSQIITSVGTNNQVLNFPPDDITVECDAIPLPTVLKAEDNCNSTVDVNPSEEITAGDCADSYIITRKWVYTNDCGVTNQRTRVITVEDNTKPTLSAAPDDVTVDCNNIPVAASLTASDNCDEDVEITVSDVRTDGACADNYILTRTWRATDNCGNEATVSQIITSVGTNNQVLNFPPDDITVECDAIPLPTVLKAEDNCNSTVDVNPSEEITAGDCADSYIITRKWVYTNDCGVTNQRTRVITVEDNTKPTLSAAPDDVTVDCNNIPVAASLTASDNCDEDVEITVSDVRTDGACADNYILTRTWRATDNCGNEATVSQIITSVGTNNQVLNFPPDDITVECDAIPLPTVLKAEDNCNSTVDVNPSEEITAGDCADSYVITRKWVYTNDCGVTNQRTRVITVEDNTKPTLSAAPDDVTVDCNNIPVAASLTASDNCDEDVEITVSDVRTDGACADNYILTRTWRATDNCGNEATVSQIITSVGTNNQVLNFPPDDITVECDAIPLPTVLKAEDNCNSTVDVNPSEEITAGDCADSYVITRKWVYTNDCGVTNQRTRVITVEDNTKPTLSAAPDDVTVDCNNIPVAASLTASDNCDEDVEITVSDVRTDGACADNYILTRTWRATDNCGNEATVSQIITSVGTNNQVLNFPPDDITVECDAIPLPTVLKAEDNCNSTVDVNPSEEITAGDCADSYVITRKWVYTNDCGVTNQRTRVITVEDNTAPVTTCTPTNTAITCSGDVGNQAAITQWNADNITALEDCATDCGTVTVTSDYDANNVPAGCDGSITVNYTIADDCGNSFNSSATATINPTDAPVINDMPEDTLVEFGAIPDVPTLTVTDYCDDNSAIEFTEEISNQTCLGSFTITRTWTVTDNCNNTKIESQIITVEDNTVPVSTCEPSDLAINCSDVESNKTAADNWNTNNVNQLAACSNDNTNSTVNVSSDYDFANLSDDCGATGKMRVTYTISDDCDNWITKTAEFSIIDTTAPTLSGVPDNITAQCHEIPAVVSPTATDNCDANVVITFAEVITDGDCVGSYTLTRTWTATDNCGNKTSEAQVITIDDTKNPILSGIPDDVTVECDAIPTVTSPTATDNCDDAVVITFNEVSTSTDCADGTIITRTWTATDNCGNQDQQSQTITIENATPPPTDYCEAGGHNTNFFWIRHVVLGDINNPTGSDRGYGNYTNHSTDIVPGSQQIITLSPGYYRHLYRVYWTVWIDYNRDGDFEDENEEIFTFQDYKILKIKFDTPTDFVPGETRMRISMKYGRLATSCECFRYGETEDYTINLLPSSDANQLSASSRILQQPQVERIGRESNHLVRTLNLEATPQLTVFPNPVRHQLNVRLIDYQNDKATVRIYNNQGQVVYQNERNTANSAQFSIDVQQLIDGLYFLSIQHGKESPLVQKFQKN